ncbi:hypothetical protein H5410_060958 [Solanum commersonii]|uniref:DUF7588 domain-containing protein n=1 Tax=Solanum commersonii TaxID=4109 RepID=A0A9J5W7N0_SOLCO|nr:hypothetical protein H5410_060958 [Solanum commersonii]
MNVHQIDFSPGSLARKYIQNEFASDKWSQFKTWFFDTYSKEDLHNISQEFYETCALHNHIMFFVSWFITTYLPLFIKVFERSYKDESGNIIKAIYLPQAPFILPNNTGITFTAFQKFIENDVATISINEINNLISQNKYLGLYVKNSSSKQPDVPIQRPPEIRILSLNHFMILKIFLIKSFHNLGQNLLVYLKILQMRWKPPLILKFK